MQERPALGAKVNEALGAGNLQYVPGTLEVRHLIEILITLVWQGTRPVLANLLGNSVEAYPTGGEAEAGFWAAVVYEEGRVERIVDTSGNEHFRAFGANTWNREHLLDSEFSLKPLTPGTEVAPTAPHVGNGRYSAPMNMGPEPQRNSIEVTGKHYPPLVKYLGGVGGYVDPSTVDSVNLTVTRVKDPGRPQQGTDHFDLWGVEADIKAVVPTPVLLSSGGVVTRSSSVSHEVKPPEYLSLLMPNEVRFEVRAVSNGELVLAANGSRAPHFEIPAGLEVA